MDFLTLKAITIPEGVVKKIESNGVILWEEPSSYTNRVPISIDTDGSIYNGVGYMSGVRLSSSGATKTESNSVATGFIPISAGDVVRIKNVPWYNINASNYLCFYDENFNCLGAITTNGSTYGDMGSSANKPTITGDSDTQLYGEVTLSSTYTTPKYIRFSSYYDSTIDISDMIVTVNEEIV